MGGFVHIRLTPAEAAALLLVRQHPDWNEWFNTPGTRRLSNAALTKIRVGLNTYTAKAENRRDTSSRHITEL